MGWSLGIPSISRSTNKKIPEYRDSEESDTFVLAGAEDLIPKFENNTGHWNEINKPYTENGIQYKVKEYRPRIEGLFAKIEKWTDDVGIVHWRTTSRDNIKTFYGFTEESRIFDPKHPTRIFQWCISHSYDDKGNLIIYNYKPEDFKNIPNHTFEKNKIGNCTNTYIKKIVYGNRTPYEIGDALPDEPDWQNEFMFHTQFDYGEHDLTNPKTVYDDYSSDWDYREDSFSNFRAAFELRTYRRCRRVLQFHCFSQLPIKHYLVKSMELLYNNSADMLSTDDTFNGFSFLTSVIQKGHKISNGGNSYLEKELPPMEFSYQQHEWNKEIKKVKKEDAENIPIGIDGSQYQWTDLFNEGISGILTEQNSIWNYKHNLSNGKFSASKPVAEKPSLRGLSSGDVQLRDIEGNGQKYLVSLNRGLPGHFLLDEEDSWHPMQTFDFLPNRNLTDPNARHIDVNGNGKTDLLISEDEVFLWYPSIGKKGYEEAIRIPKPRDEEDGPVCVFADSENTIFLADFTGDGLTDIVRIRKNGEVCYWANMGYGFFSAKVDMGKNLDFGNQDNFNPQYLHLADVDGSGTADIIYLGKNKFEVWVNHNGNKFSDKPVEIDPFPEMDNLVNVQIADFLGSGTSCIVHSSPKNKDSRYPIRYIDLMGSKKPHLMTEIRNGYGKITKLHYCSSIKFYLKDKESNNPWITKLPFPVHVLEKTETFDKISGSRFVSSYSYHHGYYDHIEKEFRGFGRVEQEDTEDYDNFIRNASSNALENKNLHQPAVLTKSWFHTGAYIRKKKVLDQFRSEYFQQADKHILPDANIEYVSSEMPHVNEVIEAHRACKSMLLRKEVYSYDENHSLIEIPYVTEDHNCYIKQIQPKNNNKHASFLVLESEAITYQYEQKQDDPRVAHSINIEIDEIGNVLKQLSVVYPRKKDVYIPYYAENLVRNSVLESQKNLLTTEQKRHFISYTENNLTNDIIDDNAYRLRLPCETKLFEITNWTPNNQYFTLHEIKKSISSVDKRLIQHQRSIFLKNDLSKPLMLGEIESLGLPYETYTLAYNENQISDIFGTKILPQNLFNAQYRLSDNLKTGSNKIFPSTDNNNEWWIPSGKAQYSDASIATNNFYQADIYTDPFNHSTNIEFKENGLYIWKITDAIGNKTEIKSFDFRVLSPTEIEDANQNLTEVRFNMLGLVAGLAFKGKGNEADSFLDFREDLSDSEISNFFNNPVANGKNLLQNATVRFMYDFKVSFNEDGSNPKPLAVASISREEHMIQNTNPKLQYEFEYSNGIGQTIMQKVQAQPGKAYTIDEYGNRVEVNTGSALRWIGNGRTILNNKGNPVKQFKPYFSTTHKFEDDIQLVEIGYSPVMYYDALNRLMKTDNPDDTFSKVEFDAWQQRNYDPNDMVVDSEWYTKRTTGELSGNVKENDVALKAEKHNNTPAVVYLDALGRPVYTIEHNKEKDFSTDVYSDAYYGTFIKLDLEGQQQYIQSAKGYTIIDYKYDLAGNMCYQNSRDAGEKWSFVDVMGGAVFQWDGNGNRIESKYDKLKRPTQLTALLPDGNSILFEKIIYGESQTTASDLNLNGQVFKQYDGAGTLTNLLFDFKGNVLKSERKVCADYNTKPNWTNEATIALLNDTFTAEIEYDALNRPKRTSLPDGSIHTPEYNETGQLHAMRVQLQGNLNIPSHLDDGNPNGFPFVKNIWYNAKGQREKIQYGNNTLTTYTYDEKNYRLIQLLTTSNAGAEIVQNLSYTYDPVGNITHVEDTSQQELFFRNAVVTPEGKYEYDAIYRLIEAYGREHAANNSNQVNHLDIPYIAELPHNNNDAAIRNYRQQYGYDELGNILKMQHKALDGSEIWNRFYRYNGILGSNRLTSTSRGIETESTTNFSDQYNYDNNGNITSLPHLNEMTWDFKNQLQEVDLGGGGKAYYLYDNQGQRVRKVVKRNGNLREERIYLGSVEVFRKYDGTDKELERWTLQVADDTGTIAQVDTKTEDTHNAEPINPLNEALIRFQYSNHLGTATIETDILAQVISYEEYHPFGTSAYRSSKPDVDFSLKRYRYTGKERDDETGLYYYGARYYLPWLGRWCSADSAGFVDGLNLYEYVNSNPILFSDPTGQGSVIGRLFRKVRYKDRLANRKSLGKNVQKDHPVQVQVRKKQRTAPDGKQHYNRRISKKLEELTMPVETGKGYFHTEVKKFQDEIAEMVFSGKIKSESDLLLATRDAYTQAAKNLNIKLSKEDMLNLDTVLLSNQATVHRSLNETIQELDKFVVKQGLSGKKASLGVFAGIAMLSGRDAFASQKAKEETLEQGNFDLETATKARLRTMTTVSGELIDSPVAEEASFITMPLMLKDIATVREIDALKLANISEFGGRLRMANNIPRLIDPQTGDIYKVKKLEGKLEKVGGRVGLFYLTEERQFRQDQSGTWTSWQR